MNRIFSFFVLTVFLAGLNSCGDASQVGTGIVSDELTVVMDSSFVASGHSIYESEVQSRTITQLLGIIEAKEYGTFSSEFVTQFMAAGEIDTTGVPVDNIDSLKLVMAIPNGSIVGDSIIPMGLDVYPLIKELPSPIYSDFDPEGYYDPDTKLASRIYACNAMNEKDSISSLSFRYVDVNLPLELGKKLYQAYLDNPICYTSPAEFTKIFPGIYVANSFGSGRVMRIQSTLMQLYYHINSKSSSTGNDTTYYAYGNYYAVTPEIITNNDIRYNMSESLISMVNQGKAVIAAPTGTEVELVFPAHDVVNAYKSNSTVLSVVNTLSMSVPAIEISNTYNIKPPRNLLLVLKNKKTEFFANNDLTDNKTSFYASYNSETKSYEFTGMREYLIYLLGKDKITEEDYTFILTPVSVNIGTNTSGYYGSTTYVESIVPYVEEPSMAELDIKKSKIILTYSMSSIKN